MAEFFPDVRFVIWTGRRFLFFGRHDFRDFTDESQSFSQGDKIFRWHGNVVENLDNILGEELATYIPLSPVNVSASLFLSRENTCTITLNMPEDRYRFRPQGQTTKGETLGGLLRQNGGLPHMQFLREGIQKDRYYTRVLDSIFSDDVMKDKDFNQFWEPEIMFQPSQIVWVEYLGRNNKWYSMFTGILQDISINAIPGKDSKITLTAISPLALFRKIPALDDLINGVLTEGIFQDSEELLPFYKVWLASTFSAYSVLNPYFSTKTLSKIPIDLMFSLFGRIANRRMGCVTKDELLADLHQGLLDSTSLGLSPVTEKDIDFYIDQINKVGFYHPKIFAEDVEEYKGFSTERPAVLSLKDLLFERTLYRYSLDGTKEAVIPPSPTANDPNIPLPLPIKYMCVGNTYIGSIFLSPELKTGALLERVTKLSLNMYKLNISTIADTLSKIAGTSTAMLFNDARGNWIMDYPRYDDLPRLGEFALYKTQEDHPHTRPKSVVRFGVDKVAEGLLADPSNTDIPKKKKDADAKVKGMTEDQLKEFMKDESNLAAQEKTELRMLYYDHDMSYIIPFPKAEVNYQVSSESYTTYLEIPFGYHYVSYGDLSNKSTGYSWGTPAECLRFGYNGKILNKIFTDVGKVDILFKNKIISSIARMFRNRYNAELFTLGLKLNGGLGHQVGRNIILPQEEKSYFISQVTHNIEVGSNHQCSLSCYCGKSLWKQLGNPWTVWAKYVNVDDLIDPEEAENQPGVDQWDTSQKYRDGLGNEFWCNPRLYDKLTIIERQFNTWWLTSIFKKQLETQDIKIDRIVFGYSQGKQFNSTDSNDAQGRSITINQVYPITKEGVIVLNGVTTLLSEDDPQVIQWFNDNMGPFNDLSGPIGYVYAKKIYNLALSNGIIAVSTINDPFYPQTEQTYVGWGQDAVKLGRV